MMEYSINAETPDSKPDMLSINSIIGFGKYKGETVEALLTCIDGVKYLELLSNGNLRLKQGATITYDL